MTIVQNYNPKHLLNASIRHEDKFFSDLLYIDFIYPVISRDQKYLTLEAKINDTKKLIFIDPSRRYYKLKVPKNLSNPQIHIKNDFLGECSFNIEDVIQQNKILFLYEIDRNLTLVINMNTVKELQIPKLDMSAFRKVGSTNN